MKVSRLTFADGKAYLADGSRACVRCLRRPAVVTPSRVQSYCAPCHAEDRRARRAGKTEMLVSAEERALIIELRRAVPAGRHHALR